MKGNPRSAKHRHPKRKVKIDHKTESLLKAFLSQLSHAAYQVALKLGFKGSFSQFLSDLQDSLEKVIHKGEAALGRIYKF